MPLPGMGGLTAAQRNQQIDKSRRETAREGGDGLTKYQRLLAQQKAQAATNRPPQAAGAPPTTRPSQPVPGAPPVAAGPVLPAPTAVAAPTQFTKPMQPALVDPQPGRPMQPAPVPPMAAGPGPVMSPAMPAPDLGAAPGDDRTGAAQLSADKQKQAVLGGGYKPQYV